MYLLYDATSLQILHAQESAPTPTSGQTVADIADTLTNASDCLSQPQNYWWDGTAIQAWPSLTASYASGTLSLTLEDATPPTGWTAPTGVTVGVAAADWTTTATLSSGAASVSLALHPSMAMTTVTATLSGTGLNDSTLTLSAGATAIGLQVYAPSGGVPTVGPVGTGSEVFLQGYYASQISAARQPGDINTALALLWDAVFGTTGAVQALVTAGTWKPTTAQSAALSYIQSHINSNLPVTLTNALDASGDPIQPVAQYAADQATSAQYFADYATDLATIPGLA